MSSSFQVEPNQLGTILKNEIYSRDGVIGENITLEYYFSVDDDAGFFTEITLKDFEDDLDLTLSKSNNGFYLPISDSESPGIGEEYIGKFLPAGNYFIEVSYYESLSDTLDTSFNLTIDSKSFYDNTVLPNDPLFGNQWYLFNTGQAGGLDNEDIMAPEAWNIRSTSPDVIVGVIDTGIQYNHPDLINNIWFNKSEILDNNIDDDGNGYVDDIIGWNFADRTNYPVPDEHGTHVGGTIGAEGNNLIGVSGVTWDVQLMSLDVFGESGTDWSYLWEAIYYAVDNKANVINMSLGLDVQGTYEGWAAENSYIDSNLKTALKYAIDNGTTVVIAAGNEELSFDQNWLSIPAVYSDLYDGVISVAAVTNTGDLSWYSNYGSQVTIAAPGGETDFEGDPAGIFNTVPMNDYDSLQGTSMASPVVTGSIALMLGENPYLNPAQVEAILKNTAFKYRSLDSLVENGGYLNLEGALQSAGALADKTVVRLYNSSTGKHLISSNKSEIDILVGDSWKNEGALYYSPEEATADVFRFYISEENRHFYTALESERDMIIGNKDTYSGWEYEGGAFSSYSTSDFSDDAVAVVRYLNEESGNHVYSTSTLVQGILDQDSNWINEGIAWYGDSFSTASNFI